ncbi:MAG: type II toxin-antitoxin system RelE/ParE family toxin [Nitrospiraceae bacterium]|jgi:mRNA interferase RelE/StbE|nr:type II toxin-antitoxin system RelE/ParE family toxin [Nitrospirota bacterium]MDA8339259.1 type II toxin-antitoxin system RelE/ParE family toxin [Nitrospiraceae bacterium]
MPYTLKYHQAVRTDDIPLLNADIKSRIRTVIETRLSAAPYDYGEPLRKTLKGYWKLRVGDYRVLFLIEEQNVLIIGIRHRKEVYRLMKKHIEGNR